MNQPNQPPKRGSQRRWLALAAVPVVAAIAIHVWPHPPGPASTGPANEAAKGKSFVSARETRHDDAPRSFHWEEGDLLTYDLETRTAVRFGQASRGTKRPGGELLLSGQCSYYVVAVNPDRVILAAQVSGATVTSNGQRKKVLEELFDSEPVILVNDRSGNRIETRVNPELPTEDRHILAAIHDQQVVLSDNPADDEWTNTETTHSGSFACRYQRRPNGSIEKHRQPVSPADGRPAQLAVKESNVTIKLGETWVDLIAARETFISENPRGGRTTLESSFHLNLVSNVAESAALARLAGDPRSLDRFTSLSLPGGSGASALRRQQMQSLQERYAGVPLDEMLDALREGVASATSTNDSVDALHGLADWLSLHPEEAFSLAETLRDPALSIGFTAHAVHALELNGKHPQSQQALAAILNRPDDFPPHVVLQAAIAAGGVGAGLGPELHHALSETTNRASSVGDFTLSDAALNSLGTLARMNPVVAEQLSAALFPDLDPANHHRVTQAALYALSNARLDSADLVTQAGQLAHTHTSAEVRTAAVQYLSRLPDTPSADLFPHLQDPSEFVQLEAVEGLGRHMITRPDVVAALEAHQATTSSDLVATRIRQVLENRPAQRASK